MNRDCDFQNDSLTCPHCGFVARVSGTRRNCPAFPQVVGGPGTELRKLLDWWGIHDNGKCGCEAFALQMDAWGPDGCEGQMPAIIDHLREAARIYGLPFMETAVVGLVRIAIQRAR